MSHNQNIKLTVINGKPTTTSRQIALYFNKRHRDLTHKITTLDCSKTFNARNFTRVDYKDSTGEIRKEYQITRDGFMYLVMGFTGKRAARYKEAYINAFNEMEEKFHNRPKTPLQQGKPKINDILNAAISLEKSLVEITYTKQGDIVQIHEVESSSVPVENKKKSTVSHKPSWQLIVELFFAEIEKGDIPENMRNNMLLSEEKIAPNERHDCLFFRASNLMAFFRNAPHLFHLMQEAKIQTATLLVKQLNAAGILAFNGKIKEKGIPIYSSTHLDINTRRVSHLVAIDLVVLEENYDITLSNNAMNWVNAVLKQEQ